MSYVTYKFRKAAGQIAFPTRRGYLTGRRSNSLPFYLTGGRPNSHGENNVQHRIIVLLLYIAESNQK